MSVPGGNDIRYIVTYFLDLFNLQINHWLEFYHEQSIRQGETRLLACVLHGIWGPKLEPVLTIKEGLNLEDLGVRWGKHEFWCGNRPGLTLPLVLSFESLVLVHALASYWCCVLDKYSLEELIQCIQVMRSSANVTQPRCGRDETMWTRFKPNMQQWEGDTMK